MRLETTKEERAAMILAATRELTKELIKESGERVALLTAARASGLLDVTPKTLADLDIPRVDLAGTGKAIRYRLVDIAEYIERQTIGGGK